MSKAKLRSVGGSVMVAIPPPLLQQLGLGANAEVDLSVEGDRLIVGPLRRSGRIGLAARLAMCDFSHATTADEHAWDHAPRAGQEEI